jgi:hypothetical protein
MVMSLIPYIPLLQLNLPNKRMLRIFFHIIV